MSLSRVQRGYDSSVHGVGDSTEPSVGVLESFDRHATADYLTLELAKIFVHGSRSEVPDERSRSSCRTLDHDDASLGRISNFAAPSGRNTRRSVSAK